MADIFDLDGMVKEALIATSGYTIGPWHIDTSSGSPVGTEGISQVLTSTVDYSGLSDQLVNFAFATATPIPTSETPVQIDTYVYANNSDIQQSQTVGSTKTTVASVQVTITQGLQTTLVDSFNVGFAGYGGASVSFSMQTSFSTADQQSQSITQQWNCTTPILVPPRKGIKLMWSVLTAEYQIPFSGSVRIAGSISGRFQVFYAGPAGPAAGNPAFAQVLTGNAVEARVFEQILTHPEDYQLFDQLSGAGRIDFVGTGAFEGFTFELTTERRVAAHSLRPYLQQPGAFIFTYPSLL